MVPEAKKVLTVAKFLEKPGGRRAMKVLRWPHLQI
jgi:hypothetical protein